MVHPTIVPLFFTAVVARWDAVRRVLEHAHLGSVRVKPAVLDPWRTLRAGESTEEETALRRCVREGLVLDVLVPFPHTII